MSLEHVFIFKFQKSLWIYDNMTWFNLILWLHQYVMIVLKGSIPIAFGGTEEPAAYGELVSIGGLNADVNKKLSAEVAEILETKLSVPKSRFFLKFYDTKASEFSNILKICLYLYCTCVFSFQISCVFRVIKVKKMHSVFMLYTSPRSHVNHPSLF